MRQIWEATYKGHCIRVENTLFRERLLIDGEVQDEHSGLCMQTVLNGRILTGDGPDEVRAELDGIGGVPCLVMVNTIPVAVSEGKENRA